MEEKPCTDRCQSVQHGDLVNAIARKGNDRQLVALWSEVCCNYGHVKDAFGRSALHAAASTSNVKAVEWLLQNEGSKINAKEITSGYTPLHTSIFCGQLNVARSLVQNGANLSATDNEGLTPVELYLLDRELMSSSKDFRIKADPTEVYTWGTNVNFNLGTGTTSARTAPEPLEMFGNLRISQVVLQCFHSTFLSQNGEVFTCGVGRGGRLGLGNETAALKPTKVNLSSNYRCVQVAAGSDHTLFLMENGEVHGCGSNANSVLGFAPDPEGTDLLTPRRCPTAKVEGIRTSDFHTVLFTSSRILTCGRNYGQLGHALKVLPNGLEKFGTPVPTPTLVPRLHVIDSSQTHLKITQVECNEFATVFLSGNIYVLYNFEFTRIDMTYAGMPEIVKIGVTGGRLDGLLAKGSDAQGENFTSTLLKTGGPVKRSIRDRDNNCPLTIILLNINGNIVIWREELRAKPFSVGKFFETPKCTTAKPYKLEGTFTKLCFGIGRQIAVSDFFITREIILLTSSDGEAFQGRLNCCEKPTTFRNIKEEDPPVLADGPGAYREFSFRMRKRMTSFCKFSTLPLECVKVKRLPNIYSAVTITCDPKAKSFAVIQRHHRWDYITVPTISPSVMNENMEFLYRTASLDDDFTDVVFEVLNENGLKKSFPAHKFVIASGCSILYNDIKNAVLNSESDAHPAVVFISTTTSLIFEQVLQYIYFNRCDWIIPGFSIKHFDNSDNMISKMAKYCRQLELKHLADKLKNVEIVDGVICLKKPDSECYHNQCNPKVFDPIGYQSLTDLTLVTSDKREIKVHKCILFARMDHFRMLWAGSTWNDSNATTLRIPTSYHGTKLLIDYLYTDALPDLDKYQSSDGRLSSGHALEEKLNRVDKAIAALSASDYFFINEFRSRAELRLYEMINLKNVSKILTVATFLNAEQLQNSCHHFIALNFAPLLENRLLDELSPKMMRATTAYYQNLNTQVSGRLLKPDNDLTPSEEAYVQALESCMPEFDLFVSNFEEYKTNKQMSSRAAGKAKRRRQNSKKDSESQGLNMEESHAQLSPLAVESVEDEPFVPAKPVKLVNISQEKGLKDAEPKQLRIPIQVPITKASPQNSAGLIQKSTATTVPLASTATLNRANTSGHSPPAAKVADRPRTLSSELSSSFEDFPTLATLREALDRPLPASKQPHARKDKNSSNIQAQAQASEKHEVVKKKIKWKVIADVSEIGKKPVPNQPSKPIACIPGTNRDPRNPWNRKMASDPNQTSLDAISEGTKKLTFKDIVQDEKEKEDNWKKLTSKSLRLMQIEETAINQLTRFYKSEDTVDSIELVSIERVSVKNVGPPPSWPPQQAQAQNSSPSTSGAWFGNRN